jgi:hypothetical protein
MGADKLALTYLPHGQAPWFPHGWLKMSGSPGYPTYDWVDHRWWMHPSSISALGGLTSTFPWNLGRGPRFKPPNELLPLFLSCKNDVVLGASHLMSHCTLPAG